MKLNYKTLEKHQNLSAFLFLAILSLFLFFLTWQCWVDPNGDGGFNLYTFWQIAEGKILYRDLFYFHGPLAPLLYGLLFKIFGISILNIAIFNLLLTWASSCTIFLIFKKLSESITAIIMGGYFLCVFAIAKKSFILEHNFIFPYKPEIPLGALLVLAGIWTLALWLEHKTIIKILFLGIIMGCGLLLSVETLIATSASIIAPLFLLFTQKPLENKKFIAPFLVGFIIPILLCFTYFIFYFEWRNALFNTFASILQPLNAKNSSWIFIYTDLAGLNNPLKNFTSLLLNTGLVLFGAVVLYALSQSIYKKYWILLQFFIAGAILVPIFLFSPLAHPYSMDVIWWANYPKIFPLCSCIFAFCTTRNLLLERKKWSIYK